jgi:hypothetical protein
VESVYKVNSEEGSGTGSTTGLTTPSGHPPIRSLDLTKRLIRHRDQARHETRVQVELTLVLITIGITWSCARTLC